MRDTEVLDNRIRNNGRRGAGAAAGGGAGVHFTGLSVTDEKADWPTDGHRGKEVTVGAQTAVVTYNTPTELSLAPVRPGADTAWPDGVPEASSAYRLPAAPVLRAGLTVDAPVIRPHLRGNRIGDDQPARTQTHGMRITRSGRWTNGRESENDLSGNALAATLLDTTPAGGLWRDDEA